MIIFNHNWYDHLVMGSDGVHTNITIPAVFVDRSAGLTLWEMMQEVRRPKPHQQRHGVPAPD